MISYKLLKDNGIVPKSILKNKSAIIIESDMGRYAIKENETNLEDTYKYLTSRGFNYFPGYKKLNNYMIYNYIEDLCFDREEKLEDLVFLLSLLHLKTTRFVKTSLDDYKIIYEDIENKVKDIYNYYVLLNDEIDSEIYMSPSKYLLVRNISIVYSALQFCEKTLNEWYELIKKDNSQRKVLIHNNFDINHLIKNNGSYLISFSKAKVDLPIYDLLSIYQNTYKDINFKNLLNIYESKYPLKKDELLLLFIYISLPMKVKFEDNEYINTVNIQNMIDKLIISDEIIKPYYDKKKTLADSK